MKITDELEEDRRFFYIALSMLMSNNKNSVLPELLYFMSTEQILLLLETFGGKRVYVPNNNEFGESLLAAIATYYVHVHEYSWSSIQQNFDISGHQLNRIRKLSEQWSEYIETETGYDIEWLLKDNDKTIINIDK